MDISSYANDNTPYIGAYIIQMRSFFFLENSTNTLLEQFGDYLVKNNPDNCHLLVAQTTTSI